MHPVRKQRLIIVLFIVVFSSLAIGLMAYALRENINLFYPPSTIAAGEVPQNTRIRAGGCVKPGSVARGSTVTDYTDQERRLAHSLDVALCHFEHDNVLVNLLDNAFYAVREKSTVENGSYEPTVSVSTQSRSGGVEITLRDNGTGIPESIRQKIFEPFFTATSSPTSYPVEHRLSYSYFIITDHHDGHMSVTSDEKHGTCFNIQLPPPTPPVAAAV